MSWGVNFLGKPKKVAEALEAHSAALSGQSRAEYDEALPHLVGLVLQTFNSEDDAKCPLVKLSASGHGNAKTDPTSGDLTQLRRQCCATLEVIHTTLV